MVVVLLGRGLFQAGKKYGPRAIPLVRGMAISRVKGIPRSLAMGYATSFVGGYMATDAVLTRAPQAAASPLQSVQSNQYGVIIDDDRIAIPYLR